MCAAILTPSGGEEAATTVAAGPQGRLRAAWAWLRRLAAFAGPGLLISVGYADPGNWQTDLAAGVYFRYQLLSVVLASSLIAMYLQSLAVRLGVAGARDLAQACRAALSPPWAKLLWLSAEVAMVATDLAEVIGSAVAINMLSGGVIPTVVGVVVTAADTLVLVALPSALSSKRGWVLEAIVGCFMLVIAGCFAAQLAIAPPPAGAVFAGFVPSAVLVTDPAATLIAVGILGATVMPHNLYLHSALVRAKCHGNDEEDAAAGEGGAGAATPRAAGAATDGPQRKPSARRLELGGGIERWMSRIIAMASPLPPPAVTADAPASAASGRDCEAGDNAAVAGAAADGCDAECAAAGSGLELVPVTAGKCVDATAAADSTGDGASLAAIAAAAPAATELHSRRSSGASTMPPRSIDGDDAVTLLAPTPVVDGEGATAAHAVEPWSDAAAIRSQLRLGLADSCVALTGALAINSAIVIVAGTAFASAAEAGSVDAEQASTLQGAYRLLEPALGSTAAPVLFALALLASGQSSTICGTLAGQCVMEGFISLRMRPWLRRAVTRGLAIIPAAVVAAIGDETMLSKLLVASQVVLAFQLPFAVIPLVVFTASRKWVGPFAVSKPAAVLGALIALLIITLNVYLLFQVFTSGI